MRNYLPAKKTIRRIKKHHTYILAVALPLALLGAAIWVRVAHADSPCVRSFGSTDLGPLGAKPGLTEWNFNGYHYKIFAFSVLANNEDEPNGAIINSQNCANVGPTGGGNVVDTNDPDMKWNGRRAVGALFGVPNQGAANANGIWQNPRSIAAPPTARPPQFQRNFGSSAAFADDSGRAAINSGRFGMTTIWCLHTVTNGNPAGIENCPPEISSQPGFERNGAGYFQSWGNCHIGDPANGFPRMGDLAPASYDQDGAGPYNCEPVNQVNPVYTWHTNYRNPGKRLFQNPGDIDMSDFIGCGGGQDCNNVLQLDPFPLYMTARQTRNDGFGAIMLMTFKYPLTVAGQVDVDKASTNGSNFIPGDTISYSIGLSKPAFSPNFVSLHVIDTLPPSITFLAATDCGGVLIPTTNNGTTTTWDFSAGGADRVIDDINNGLTRRICFDARANSVDPNAKNLASVTGTTATGSFGPTNDFATVQILNPKQPFLTTTRGDVNAGGGIGVNCGAPGPDFIRTTSGKGDYLVSAGGTINGFGSAGSAASNALTKASYFPRLCRPDLVADAVKYIATAPIGSVITVPNNPLLVKAALEANNNKLIHVVGDLDNLPAVNINGRVTLYVEGRLRLAGNITKSNAPCLITCLASFGVITTGDIDVNKNVTSMEGYYYSRNGAFHTCYPYGVTQLEANCRALLTINGLVSANRFFFNRVGGNGVGPVNSETINYSGLLFVAPPPVFDGAFTSSTLGPQDQDELPPRY
jgi:hypothetical protein